MDGLEVLNSQRPEIFSRCDYRTMPEDATEKFEVSTAPGGRSRRRADFLRWFSAAPPVSRTKTFGGGEENAFALSLRSGSARAVRDERVYGTHAVKCVRISAQASAAPHSPAAVGLADHRL